jgi:predicted Zn-dependent peptidase
MIEFEKYTLANGLKIILHKDDSTPIAAVNLLYNVGAKDENPDKTGFAHLFEHLMFGGSEKIPDFDTPLQEAGGSSNAFTNNDFTNYYETLPVQNIETAFWLEADRMRKLAFTQKSLDVQKKVVIEEFKQNYLNQPYGDIWLLLRPLAYKSHPYRWATIGQEISHIENACLNDVKEFFYAKYAPNNAILSVAGNFEIPKILDMIEKRFGDIEKREIKPRSYPFEKEQNTKRTLTVNRDVPVSMLFKVYHMCGRNDEQFYSADLLSDILSNGDSSRLYQSLVKKKTIFLSLDAYITGTIDNGLFVFSGKINPDVDIETAETELNDQIEKIKNETVEERELQKVKNKAESKFIFSQTDILSKAMNLSYYELLDNAGLINSEIEKYNKISINDIKTQACQIFNESKCNTLYYKALLND